MMMDLIVVLLGCPASTDKELWMSLRQVVSGRLVNGYSKNDGILCYLHRIEVILVVWYYD